MNERHLMYLNRILWSTLFILILFVITIHILPKRSSNPIKLSELLHEPSVLITEVVIATQQNIPSQAAPPPRPFVSVPEPKDILIEEDITFLDIDFPPLNTKGKGIAQHDQDNVVVSNPDILPFAIEIVEWILPTKILNQYKRIDITVNFLVNRDGSVKDVSLHSITYHNKNNTVTIARHLPPDLYDSLVETALKWKFKAAIKDNKAVKAYTKETFSMGF